MFRRSCRPWVLSGSALTCVSFKAAPASVRCGGDDFLKEHNLGALVSARQTEPDKLAHYGRLKLAHEVTRKLFGTGAEKVQEVWGQKELELAKRHVPTCALNPHCFLLTTGHAALACLNGAKLLGNPASPAPASTFLVGIGKITMKGVLFVHV